MVQFRPMKKPFHHLALAVALSLTACGQASPPPTATSPPAPTATIAATPTAILPTAAEPPAAASAPRPTATAGSLFSPVANADWVHGPAGARATIVEYGDFQ